jgi:hypothetical protein
MTTTKATDNLFPLLTVSMSLSNSDVQSKFKSQPSVSSFVLIEKQKHKNNIDEKHEFSDKKEQLPNIKRSFSRFGNNDAIKMILSRIKPTDGALSGTKEADERLKINSVSRILNAANQRNENDSVGSVNFRLPSIADQEKSYFQKYFSNLNGLTRITHYKPLGFSPTNKIYNLQETMESIGKYYNLLISKKIVLEFQNYS